MTPRPCTKPRRPSSSFIQELETDLSQNEETKDVKDPLKQFYTLTTNVERVNFVYKRLHKEGFLLDLFQKDRKNEVKAAAEIEKGRRAVKKTDYGEALRHYTKCLMEAENPKLLALAYGERSEVLFKMEMFEECTQDINRALQSGISSKRKSLLVHRQKRAEFNLRSNPRTHPYQEVPRINPDLQHPSISCATKSVEIRLDANNRRRVFAAEDIQVGDVVAVEDPACFVITRAELYHCHHCFELCYNPIPCKFCTQTVFCDEKCRQEAMTGYHKYECSLVLTLHKISDVSKLYQLALRATLCLEDDTLLLTDDLSSEEVEDQFHTSVAAAVIFYCVKKHTQKFFFNKDSEDAFKNALFMQVRLCSSRSSSMSELCQSTKKPKGVKLHMENVGYGMYFFYSMVRHSCAPNLIKHHHGTKRVLRAIRTINKGEECLVSYGLDYHTPRKQRQEWLYRKHKFVCGCKACKTDWVLDKSGACMSPEVAWCSRLLAGGEVHQAKLCLDFIKNQIERNERREPDVGLSVFTNLLAQCYCMLGNRRRPNLV